MLLGFELFVAVVVAVVVVLSIEELMGFVLKLAENVLFDDGKSMFEELAR